MATNERDETGQSQRYGPDVDELRFRFEVVTVGGDNGKNVRASQAHAIKEILEWVHDQHHPNGH